jgi:hypothetical protein
MTNNSMISWRPIAIVAALALLLTLWRGPWLLLLLGGAGAYLLYRGWQGWQGRGARQPIYWRGRRVDPAPTRATSWASASPETRLSLIAGGVMVVAALFLLMQRLA